MPVKSVFIGTRVADKRYGPQSRDMAVSELISLVRPYNRPAQYVLPDFSGLVRHLDNRMRRFLHSRKRTNFAVNTALYLTSGVSPDQLKIHPIAVTGSKN